MSNAVYKFSHFSPFFGSAGVVVLYTLDVNARLAFGGYLTLRKVSMYVTKSHYCMKMQNTGGVFEQKPVDGRYLTFCRVDSDDDNNNNNEDNIR